MTLHHTYDDASREILLQSKDSGGTVVASYDRSGPGDFDGVRNRLSKTENGIVTTYNRRE